LVGDHQSKPDIGVAIARQWFDSDNVDMVIGFDNSSVALAVEQVAAQKNSIAIAGCGRDHRFHRQGLHGERSGLGL
jgi:branched-chain amino acid transport system substrate-binding protein